MKKFIWMAVLIMMSGLAKAQETIFLETCGNPTNNGTASSYTGWSNPIYPTFMGNATLSSASPSTGYADASGGGNVYFRNSPNVSLFIDWVNTKGYLDVVMTFGMLRAANGSVNAHLKIETSTDGVVWKNLPFSSVSSSLVNPGWELCETANRIPTVERLRIRFSTHSASPRAFRIDDISLQGLPDAVLPVTVSSFRGTPYYDFNRVNWTTYSESRISNYVVNSSTDGKNWRMISTVESKWMSLESNQYQVDDYDVRPGVSYYQLLIYEESGHVHRPLMAAVMRGPDEEVTYYDLMGQVVKKPQPGVILFRKKNYRMDKVYINDN